MLKIFHGSIVPVETPKILKSERQLDFGEGFYTTTNREQAEEWAQIVAYRNETKNQYLSEYEFDIDKAEKDLKIILFKDPDEAWLDFVCVNRSGRTIPTEYDIASGPVANDKVYTVVQFYENGIYDKDEAIKRLKVDYLYNQILFHSEKSLKYICFVKYEQLRG